MHNRVAGRREELLSVTIVYDYLGGGSAPDDFDVHTVRLEVTGYELWAIWYLYASCSDFHNC